MTPEKKITSLEELSAHMTEVFFEAACETEETLDQALKEEGCNPEELAQDATQLIRKLKGQARLEQARQQREALLNLLDRVRGAAGGRGDAVRAWIREWYGPNPVRSQAALAFFHKLEEVNEEDLTSLAEDAELLELIEKMSAEGTPDAAGE